MTAGSDAGQLLVNFTDDVGIPTGLVMDSAGGFTGEEKQFIKEACRMQIQLHTRK